MSVEEERQKLVGTYFKLKQVQEWDYTGPNSNTYAKQLLTKAGLRLPAFMLDCPGWDYNGEFRYGGTYFSDWGYPSHAYIQRKTNEFNGRLIGIN